MFAVSDPGPTLIRPVILTLLVGALLLTSAPMAAQREASCSVVDAADYVIWREPPPTTGGSGLDLRIKLKIAEDGSVAVHTLRLRHEHTRPESSAARPRVLVAIPHTAEVTCEDLNGNGKVGLTAVTSVLRHPRSGDRVPFSLRTAEGQDLDASGTYTFVAEIGDETLTIERQVRLEPGQREGRR